MCDISSTIRMPLHPTVTPIRTGKHRDKYKWTYIFLFGFYLPESAAGTPRRSDPVYLPVPFSEYLYTNTGSPYRV